MRLASLTIASLNGLFLTGSIAAQQPLSDAGLLAKARALYDAPFSRGLISFDCEVQFDWKQHLMDVQHFMGPNRNVAPQAISATERLQTVAHRVFVDRSGAVVSAAPNAPDVTGNTAAVQLEQAFQVIVKVGVDTWMPFASHVILPLGPTKYQFQKIETGYRIEMSGDNLSGTLDLSQGLNIVSGNIFRPQTYQFKTEFTIGPDGYLLQSISTNSATDNSVRFDYTYQTVQGVQLPLQITEEPATAPHWRYALSGCKVVKGIVLNVGPTKQ